MSKLDNINKVEFAYAFASPSEEHRRCATSIAQGSRVHEVTLGKLRSETALKEAAQRFNRADGKSTLGQVAGKF